MSSTTARKNSHSGATKPSLGGVNKPSQSIKSLEAVETGGVEEAGTGRKNYQGSGKKTNDVVFEKKRSEYDQKMRENNECITKLKNRTKTLSDQFQALVSGDGSKGPKAVLRKRLQDAKEKRRVLEEERLALMEKRTQLEESHKRKNEEYESARAKLPFKKVEDIEKRIKEIESQLESGTLKLIEEKRLVAEISKLHKNRKELDLIQSPSSSYDDWKKELEAIKVLITEKSKAIYVQKDLVEKARKELDLLSSQEGSHQTKIDAINAEREKIRAQMSEEYNNRNAIWEEFQKAQVDHKAWVEQDKIKRKEASKKKEIDYAIGKLEEEMKNLELPPNAAEIDQCTNLKNFLKENYLGEMISSSSSSHSLTVSNEKTAALRQVEKLDTDVVLKSKSMRDEDEECYFKPTKKAASKAKPSSKPVSSNEKETAEVKFPFWVISGLQGLGISFGTSKAEIETIVKLLDDKRQSLLGQQEAKLKGVNDERAKLTALIEKQKKRLETVRDEVIKELKEEEKGRVDNFHGGRRPPPSSNQPLANAEHGGSEGGDHNKGSKMNWAKKTPALAPQAAEVTAN